MKTNHLGAWALISTLLFGVTVTTGCNATSVAQNIVNWTPVIVSTANTIDGVVAKLDPPNAALILLAGTTFSAAAYLVDNQAKTYLANPSLTNLQQLQAQALAFQSNVNQALLQAAKITNPASQQKVKDAISAAVTAITAVLALLQTIKGNTVGTISVSSTKISQVLPLMDERKSIALVAQHYGEPQFMAAYQVHQSERSLQAAGL